MKKVILISDIHIADRRTHNFYPGFRLEQFDRVADRLVKYIEENEIDEVWEAGDLVDNARMKPNEAIAAHNFVKKICETRITKFNYILGNHDIGSKQVEHDGETQSIVPLLVMASDKVNYVNLQVLDYEGVSVAFQNWESDLSVIDFFEKADLYIGHVNLMQPPYGAEFDQSRFKEGLCGDIHTVSKRGKSHTINSIIQSNAGDAPDGSFIRIDFQDGKYDWSRVPTAIPGEFDFLRVYRSDDMPDDYIPQKYDVIRDVAVSEETTESVALDDIILDEDKLISQVCDNEAVEVIVKGALKTIDSSDLKLSTLKFGKMGITNFKSISNFVLDFSDLGKITQITGNIGAGKSSIINALDFVLKGGSIQSLKKIGTKDFMVSLSYEWDGTQYYIERSKTNITRYEIEGIEQHGSIRELDKLFNEENPWLSVWTNFMSLGQFSMGFLVSYNEKERAAFLAKLLGYDKFLEVNGILAGDFRKVKQEVKATKEESISRTAIFNDSLTKFKAFSEENNISSVEEAQSQLLEIDSNKNEIDSQLIEWNKNLSLWSAYEATVRANENTQKTISSVMEQLKLKEEASKVFTQEKRDQVSGIQERHEKSEVVKVAGMEAAAKLKEAKKALEAGVCYACGQATPGKEDDGSINKLEENLVSLRSQYTSLAVKSEELAECSAFVEADSKAMSELKIAQDRAAALPVIQEVPEPPKLDEENLRANIASATTKKNELEGSKMPFLNWIAAEKEVGVNQKASEEAEKALVDVEVISANYQEAVELTGTTGKLTAGFLKVASEVLTDGAVKVSTEDGAKTKFQVTYQVDGIGEVPYDQLSGGQRSLTDLILISRLAKLVGGIPLLILDETLKFLSDEASIELVDSLRTSDIENILLVSHGSEIPQVDHTITPPTY